MTKLGVSAFLRTVFFGGGPVALLIMAKTGISADDYQLYYNAAIVIVPPAIVAGYEFYLHWRNRPDVLIKHAEQVPDVAKVVIRDGTNGEIGKMVASDDHPKVMNETTNNLKKDGLP